MTRKPTRGNRVTAVRTPVYPGVVTDCCTAVTGSPGYSWCLVLLYHERIPLLGALNKAILTAELAPIVGDIKFPEGVLLGAAMESTEDLLNLLEGYGLGSAADWFDGAEEKAQDAGEIVAGQIVKICSAAREL